MKIAIIGAGHIGSAIVTCLAQGHLYNEKDIIVSNPNIDCLPIRKFVVSRKRGNWIMENACILVMRKEQVVVRCYKFGRKQETVGTLIM